MRLVHWDIYALNTRRACHGVLWLKSVQMWSKYDMRIISSLLSLVALA